jgi:polyphenol oxidase
LTAAKHAKLKKDSAQSWYRFEKFARKGANAVFSTRRFHMDFTSYGHDSLVVAHRKHFCELVGIPFGDLVFLEQVHSGNIVRIKKEDRGRGARSHADAIRAADAAITDAKEVALAVRSADCAPVFFYDKTHQAVGLAHIGWKGASERLASKMVQAFRHQFLSKPGDLRVALGPMIRGCCYEVGEEFKNVFGSFVIKRKKLHYLHLDQWIINDLQAEGVSKLHIYDSGYCTKCLKEQFPSYRLDKADVRHMMSAIQLKPRTVKHAS